MTTKSIITHVTPVGGNIFIDLGFEPDEAARLLAESNAIISAEVSMKMKEALQEQNEDPDDPHRC